jgi:hypothetical protein
MNKKVKIYNPQYAQGGITQQDIQKYLMSQQQQQQPQITEDALVDIIYNELTLLGDKAGYVDQGYIDDIADKITQGYNLNSDYIVNLVNEVYSTLAPSDLQYQNATIAQGSPVPKLDMKEGQDDYQEDLREENLEENVATYDDYYGDDTDMSEMKFGGMPRKKFMQNFIRKAQEGMEQEADESVIGNNDIQDGRDALVKGFESSVKKSVVKAVAKNQFDKMKQESSYFSEGGFYDPNNLGDDEAYAHHLNLMAQAGKDIFNQPQMTMAKDGREQRRANRDQRRVGRDVQKALNNLPGLYPGGFNVYSMPGQMMPDMSQLGQGVPPFTIEGERNIFGGLKSYKASFEGGLPINFMAGMMSGRRGRGLNMLSSISGYPTSFYSQQSYSNPGQIIYETVNNESLKEVDQNTPGNTSTEVKEGQGSTVPGGSTVPQTVPGVGQTIVPPLVSPRVTVPPIVPEIDRRKFQDDLEPVERPGKNYKEWQTKDGGKGISYEGIYKTGMLGTEHPARYQVIYKPDGSIDKAKSFVAVSQSDYGGTIYVPWDKQGTFMYEEGGMVMNSDANPFGPLQEYVYGGYNPSVAELDGTNLVDPSDPYTRQFANGGTQDEYQQYIDWYNEDAPQEGMRKAAPQSYEQWMAENYPQNKSEQTIVPRYNPQNAALAAQYMSQALGFNRTSPIGTLGRSINPFSISRGMVQKGMPMIAGTNIPFAGAFGSDTRISEIYTDPRRFGKDAVHVKFMVPGQEGPMLGMDWQNQVQQQQQQKGAPEVTSERGMRRDVMEGYGKSKKRGLEDETQIAIRQGERDVRGDVRRAMRKDPDAFYEGDVKEGMTAPMSDADYMALVKAKSNYVPAGPRAGATGSGIASIFEGLDVPPVNTYRQSNPAIKPLYAPGSGSGSGMYNIMEDFAYGGPIKFPDGGFVYNNPVDYNTNPVMANQNFFDVNTNNNSIPDYLEWQSTPDQEVDVAYKQKNKINFEPRGLFPFLGKGARNTREALDNNMIDNFNTQNMMSSNSRVAPTEMLSQGRYDINTGREIETGFEGIVGAGLTQQTYSKFGGQLEYEEGGEYDLTEEEIQALIDAGVDITLL